MTAQFDLFDDLPLEISPSQRYVPPVGHSVELDRILKIPTWSEAPFVNLDHLKRSKCTMTLKPKQIAALQHAYWTGGLFAPLGVGTGKTLIALLLPTLLDKKAVIFCPASVKPQFLTMAREYDRHFLFRRDTQIFSYSQLSVASGSNILDEIAPEMIVCDEAHMLANPQAARTKRFLRYFKSHDNTVFCGLSGTMTKRSPKDFGHLLDLSLGVSSPLPRDWATLTEWAEALAVTDHPRPVGKLVRLLSPGEEPTTQNVRQAWSRRMTTTLGVCASASVDVGASLIIHVVKTYKSRQVDEAIKNLWGTWCRPDGEELVTALDVSRIDRQLKVGGYKRWAYAPKREWLDARADWHKALRYFLQRQSQKGLDAPLLISNACERNDAKTRKIAPLWFKWKLFRDLYPLPPSEWIWVDKAHLHRMVDSVRGPAIIWVSNTAAGQEAAKYLGTKYYGQGESEIVKESGTRTIIASIHAHKEGKNLQQFSRSVVLQGPKSGEVWEQLIGRTHRTGQTADTVEVFVPDIFLDDLKSATKDATYQKDMTQNDQRLLFATRAGW